ncbi:hypothetical protein PDJAM_G00055060 [Pangasius djambal]|uniref:Uncharacterized protein n=1 Tax=Pangasius djambal TaxID=1691987 RepID=A0ACC5YXH9_9TELE|nr:hypothetical protein [Pangasius djambal]
MAESLPSAFLRRLRSFIPVEFTKEVKELSALALPVFLSYVMVYLIGFVSVVFCGHLGRTILAGVALATAIINVSAVSIGYGLASACSTLISQPLAVDTPHCRQELLAGAVTLFSPSFQKPPFSVRRRYQVQTPRASLSPCRGDSPVFFERPDQCPAADASDVVSFGATEDEPLDDSMSLAASNAEDISGSPFDPAPSPSMDSSVTKTSTDTKLFRVLSKAVEELGLEWSTPEEPTRSRLDEWFLPGCRQAPRQRAAPFFPEVHDELTKSWRAPYSARLRTSVSSAFSTVDGAVEKGYEKLPPLDESVAAHLCPPTAIGWRAKVAHPSKLCRTTSALAGRAYSSAGQEASALHSMAVLQVFQAKLLQVMDESGPDSAAFKELRSATDLALRATKATAQAIGRSMANLVVLERHLWLNLTEIKEVDKVPFLEGFAERFTDAQKSSQALQHFLPKRSSSASATNRPKPAPTQQPARATLALTQPTR